MSSSSPPPRRPRLDDSPAAALLAATAARRYYLEGASKSEIATELGLSRFKVARILDQALSSGLVRIELNYEGEVDLDLSVQLARHLRIWRCLVVDNESNDSNELRLTLGRVLARYLSETTTTEDVLGLAWSRTNLALSAALTSLAACPVVQLSGVLYHPDVDYGSTELVKQVAQIGRGTPYCFYTPMIVPDADTAKSLGSQREVAIATSMFATLTKAVVSIGAWTTGNSTVADTISAADFEAVEKMGVCAEVAGIQFDAQGQILHTPVSDRTIGITATELRAVPEVIVSVYGPVKVQAVLAAVRAGLVTTLVTHSSIAKELLALPRPERFDYAAHPES